jgi:hypothetical protein
MNVIQRVMVELLEQTSPSVVDDGKIHNPARRRIDGTAKRNLDAVAVTVHARALVSHRHAWQVVGGLE